MSKRPKTECCIEGEEMISMLPDDILVRVLSLLSAKEVTRCGVLSRRWTTLPKLIPMALKFFRKFRSPYLTSLDEEEKFIRRVNQVLDSYPGETLAELSISYELMDLPLDICSQLSNWVQFAMRKKVVKFELDLSRLGGTGIPYGRYQFPPIPIGSPICTSLTELRLHSVHVTDEHIKYFLECSPFLHSLSVIGSDTLTSLKVDGSIPLMFLEIRCCYNLVIFEISAPNLISFKYNSHPVTSMRSMPLKCAPQLNELGVAVGFYNFLIDNFPLFTSYFARIETLSLTVVAQEFPWPVGIPTLGNLKNLTVHATTICNNSLMSFASWIEASPLLRRFVFKRNGLPSGIRRIAAKPWMCPHNFLKEVEFIGFTGDVLDTELVMYIIENAINLEKIVFDCRYPTDTGIHIEDTKSSEISFARAQAREFQSKLSSEVEFVLIP